MNKPRMNLTDKHLYIMERDKEIQKLVNVLRRTAKMAQQAGWTGDEAVAENDGASFNVNQYNRVLDRLIELEPNVGPVFTPLSDDATHAVVAMACRQLAAYFEDEVKAGHSWGQAYGAAFDSDSFKNFWSDSAKEIEDLGEFIRENLETWANKRGKKNTKATTASDENAE